jgi:hypothetical protein
MGITKEIEKQRRGNGKKGKNIEDIKYKIPF